MALSAAPSSDSAGQPNVVLLSVDTLRADRLGCYGYPLATSPRLDAFAKEALLFEEAICEVPLTSPSFGSMLSSRYPRMNGATRNGLRMPDLVPLVQEVFRNAGYQTFCVQSNWTLKGKLSGLNRGFDIYDEHFDRKRWGFIKPERRADEVSRIAREWLAARDPARPFFAWIHFSDPHAPYRQHRDYNPSGKRTPRRGKEQSVRARYDSEIAFTDQHIQEVLDALPENTCVVFVADHGESLYEHDYLGHGRRIHQTGLHIPLMIRAAGVSPGRSKVPARGTDIGPTLLGLAALPRPPGMLGLDLLHDSIPAERPRVIETYGGAVPHVPGAKALMADAKPLRQGVIEGGWKLILGGETPELYHLADDPQELQNLARRYPERVEKLRARITEWDASTSAGEGTGEKLSEEDVRALGSLGYLD